MVKVVSGTSVKVVMIKACAGSWSVSGNAAPLLDQGPRPHEAILHARTVVGPGTKFSVLYGI